MNRFVLSPAAEMDLEAIWDYIAQDSLDAADRWIEKLLSLASNLGPLVAVNSGPSVAVLDKV